MKTTVSLTIDFDVITELRNRNINISQLVNAYLRSYVGSPEMELHNNLYDTEQEILLLQTKIAQQKKHMEDLKKKGYKIVEDE
jgi:hypothetical protein